MIRVENIVKHFGEVQAVNGLSFDLYEGEILGFLGPNGAGKTTTMRILTCFFPPTSGTATVAGFDILAEPDEVRRVIGYMPEGVPMYKDMSVYDFLDFVGHSKGLRRTERKKYVNEAIDETNLGEVRNRLVGQLSKGFKQRVGLAQAIIGDPKVLILDEPTSGLDPRQIADMRSLIKGMAGRRTVILSTHILPEVQMTCNRVIIINKGKIAASGTPEKLTSSIQNRFEHEISVIGDANKIMAALKSVEGVIDVKTSLLPSEPARGLQGTVNRFVITSGIESRDVRPAVAGVVNDNGWKLLELTNIGLSLEDIFLRVVAGDTEDSTVSAEVSEPEKVEA